MVIPYMKDGENPELLNLKYHGSYGFTRIYSCKDPGGSRYLNSQKS